MSRFGVCIFEDHGYRGLLPLTYSRAAFELRCGMLQLWEKVAREYEDDTDFFFMVRPHLAEVAAERLPFPVNDLSGFAGESMLFVNGRLLSPGALAQLLPLDGKPCCFLCDGQVLACRLEAERLRGKWATPEFFAQPGLAAAVESELPPNEVKATLVGYAWELVHNNPAQIGTDFEDTKQGGKIEGEVDERAVIYNARAVHISPGARIDAGVVLDARGGPVFIGTGARLSSGTRVEGPCCISDNTFLVGGRITGGCTFGPWCRVGGEVEQTVFQGYSNKYHEGFVGHSYVGEWVNLGALTTTSDLKNTYGNVSVIIDGQATQTNMLKVGSFVGDFAKTGIGTLLDTGTVLGFSCNVFGGRGMLPKYVPSYAWGDGESLETYVPQKAVATARIVMERRGVEMSQGMQELMFHIFSETESERKKIL